MATAEYMREYMREWKKSNPDYFKNWRKNNPDYHNEWRRNHPKEIVEIETRSKIRRKRNGKQAEYYQKNREKILVKLRNEYRLKKMLDK